MIRRHEFQFSFLFVVLVSFIYPISLVYGHLTDGKDIGTLMDPRYAFIGYRYSDVWYYMYMYFPLILMFPFAYSYAVDKRTNYDSVMISRSGIRKYLFSKAYCCLIGGFIITFTPAILNMLVNTLFLPYTETDIVNSLTDAILDFRNDRYFARKSYDAYLWLVHPQFCFLLSSFRIGVLGATFSLVIYVISMLIKNLRIFYFSVVPVLLFFVISHRLQDNNGAAFCIDILEYAFAGSYITYYPVFFWGICAFLILLSFVIINRISKKDQI